MDQDILGDIGCFTRRCRWFCPELWSVLRKDTRAPTVGAGAHRSCLPEKICIHRAAETHIGWRYEDIPELYLLKAAVSLGFRLRARRIRQ
jgi:hypothetical protein